MILETIVLSFSFFLIWAVVIGSAQDLSTTSQTFFFEYGLYKVSLLKPILEAMVLLSLTLILVIFICYCDGLEESNMNIDTNTYIKSHDLIKNR